MFLQEGLEDSDVRANCHSGSSSTHPAGAGSFWVVDVEGIDGIGGSGVELEDSISDVDEAVSSVPMEALNEIGSRLWPHR